MVSNKPEIPGFETGENEIISDLQPSTIQASYQHLGLLGVKNTG